LLVGVADYESAGLGWGDLSADRDLEVLRTVLGRHEFDEVRVLLDRQATRAGLLGALERLAEDVARGDVVHFHYSGHGQQITDDDGDEIDGYDELLVPFDAPKSPPAGYTGGSHVRDDELGARLRELRSKLGPEGDLLVTLDSCYSGSGTRGEAAVRGSERPIGPPRPRAGGANLETDGGVGFADQPSQPDSSSDEAELAPYAAFSAASHNELAFETRDEDGRGIGSLSWALANALESAGPDTLYTTLFERLSRSMSRKVRNRPQPEGELDRTLFGGSAIGQQAFYRVLAVNLEAAKARIEGGAVAGLLEGTEVEIHAVGSRGPGHAQPLAKGIVSLAATTTSDLDLSDVANDRDLEGKWAIVTTESFGTLKSRVRLDGPGAPWRRALESELGSSSFVELVDAGSGTAELSIGPPVDGVGEDPGSVVLRRTGDGTVLLGPIPAGSQELVALVRDRLRDLARNLYLQRLELSTASIAAWFEIEPCQLDCSIDPVTNRERCRCGGLLLLERFTNDQGELELRDGDGFRLKLSNEGTEGVHLAILDLKPDGRVGLLWPFADQAGASDNFLARGREFSVPVSYRIEGVGGREMFKLIASRDFVDFRGILSADARAGEPRGPLDTLFGDVLAGARTGGWSESGVSTFEVAFWLREN
jgi:hypothetical protein